MNNWNLEYILAVADAKSFSKAAKSLFVSQPALSLYIQKVEGEIGLKLFNRKTSPLSLTFAGERFIAIAKQIVNLEHQLQNEINTISSSSAVGRLKIGISWSCANAILPNILPKFREVYPMIDVTLVEGSAKDLENFAVMGTTDITIINLPLVSSELKHISIFTDDIIAVVPKKYFPSDNDNCFPCKKEKAYPSIDLKLLKDCPFLLPKEGMRVRQVSEVLFRDAGFVPNIVLEGQSISMLVDLSMTGIGVTLVHEKYLAEKMSNENIKNVVFFYLSTPISKSSLVIAYKKDNLLPTAAKLFIDMVQSMYNDTPYFNSNDLGAE